ncbi:MAG TPA: YciI-like protein [Bordetella sp.]|nr:YciI-like protein [Bordetella sp.]
MHYLLAYEFVPDYLARRAQYRDAHLDLAWQASSRGEMVLAGAVGDPLDGALLVFQADSPAVAEAFAKSDPYVTNGLVTRWTVKPWHTVVGEQATTPVKPASAG